MSLTSIRKLPDHKQMDWQAMLRAHEFVVVKPICLAVCYSLQGYSNGHSQEQRKSIVALTELVFGGSFSTRKLRKLRALVRIEQMTKMEWSLDKSRRGTLRFKGPVVSKAQRTDLRAWWVSGRMAWGYSMVCKSVRFTGMVILCRSRLWPWDWASEKKKQKRHWACKAQATVRQEGWQGQPGENQSHTGWQQDWTGQREDSMEAQCEPGVRRCLEQAAWDTRLVIRYFLCEHVIKQRGLDILTGDFTRIIGLMN